jgi:hypothetical protein
MKAKALLFPILALLSMACVGAELVRYEAHPVKRTLATP